MYVNRYASFFERMCFLKKSIVLKEHSVRSILCPQVRQKAFFEYIFNMFILI